jgi:hypothetical protein
VYQYASKNDKKSLRTYTWGLAEHGALGEPQFIKPVIRGRYPIKYMHRPYRLGFGEEVEVVLMLHSLFIADYKISSPNRS